MFLKLAGIEGESADAKHPKEIDIMSWTWGCSNSSSAHSGTGSGAGKVSVQDITIHKFVDKSTPVLFALCASGTHLEGALLTVRKAGGTDPVEYLKLTMEKVFITSYSTGGSPGEDRLTESVTINFAKVKVEYTPQEGVGSGAASNSKGWDIAGNVEWS
jgi:type VI secretion system secreted protein Hcp